MPKKTESPVARYIAELPDEIRRIAAGVRRIVLDTAPGITEELKWGMPWFSRNGRVCYLAAHREHVTFGFAKGASLSDPDRLLEGTGKSMRHVKIPTLDQLRRRQFAKWVREAVGLNGGPHAPRRQPGRVKRLARSG